MSQSITSLLPIAIIIGSLLLSKDIHQQCIALSQYQSALPAPYEALFCGYSRNISSLIPMEFGLAHFFVVSGFHLFLLNTVLMHFSFFRKSNLLRLSIIAFFCGCCHWSAPASRSFTQLALVSFNTYYRLNWGKFTPVLASAFICLGFKPDWFNSISFSLSLIASLIISLPVQEKQTSFRFYLFMSPILLSFGVYSPLQVLLIFLFQPFFTFFLFPITTICFFILPLRSIGDIVWENLALFSNQLVALFSHQPITLPNKLNTFLCLILLLSIIFLTSRSQKWKRYSSYY